MPRIFDNIAPDQKLLPALRDTIGVSNRADFCVGYFNLRGWKQLDSHIDKWSGGDGACCRLMVGMQRLPQDELRTLFTLRSHEDGVDQQTVLRLKKKMAEEFRMQLALGAPTNEDEAGLRRLSAQIKAKKVVVKLFLRHPLHAKLYLLFRSDPINPIVGYLGSSNLTFAGLSHQGELNVDVLDGDACTKLEKWFNDRWNDRWCLDISDELATIIDTSWAREEVIPPYHIYVKMAYHLSQEARAGLAEFRIPKDFGDQLFEFQTAAVKIAARHLNKRGGVLIGDVVGLGKTLMATALARIFEDDFGMETLIICPKNLVPMWESYREQYRMRAKIVSLSQATQVLPQMIADTRRYRLVLIDESHNLRNREGKRFKAIQEYVHYSESKVILLSATPYNKSYLDLSSQLRLFVPEDKDVGVRPEQYLKNECGGSETEFIRRHQCPIRSLPAFEKSLFADDWRELMRLYLVRRTRTFIQDNYGASDCPTCSTSVPSKDGVCSSCGREKQAGDRRYLTFADGTRSYFPTRVPKTLKFEIKDADPSDQYARLFAPDVVEIINDLNLPRYGLGNYIAPTPHESPTPDEANQLRDLSRAGKRLMGFCRTNLFKRLESSGNAFLQSIERHILRNYIFLHAIENDLPIPIGTQDVAMLDSRQNDEDDDAAATLFDVETETESEEGVGGADLSGAVADGTSQGKLLTEADYQKQAAQIYDEYSTRYKRRYKWLRPSLFIGQLSKDLKNDAAALMQVFEKSGAWDAKRDAKLLGLIDLLQTQHPQSKVLIFTQFADTVRYLETQLKQCGITHLAGATGGSVDPAALAWRFSPESNNRRNQVQADNEIRVLVATDVLSEGQNLQDCSIIVNYDLPWAIIRLIQRAGRVDRIGQQAENILVYTFLPAEGVERIIKLRARVRQRLQENAEVVGTDEAFFEDDRNEGALFNLYHENAGSLDGDADGEVDLASHAFQIWSNAIKRDAAMKKTIEEMPPVVYSTRSLPVSAQEKPEGVLVYVRTTEGNDALAWMDSKGNSVTESQFSILQAAECAPDTPAVVRLENHHDLVRQGVELISHNERLTGGQLGRPSGARFRTYERLKRYANTVQGTLFDSQELKKAIDDIYNYPLRQSAVDTLNRQLRSDITDATLAELVIALREEDRLCIVQEDEEQREPQILCTMGLRAI